MKRVLVHLARARLCDIVDPGAEFPVHPGLQWVDAPDDVSAATHEYSAGLIVEKPGDRLAEARIAKLRDLAGQRKAAILADVTVSGKAYPTDAEYREIISSLSSRASRGKPLPGTLRGRSGVPTPLTPALLDGIEDAIAAQMQAAWDQFWARYDTVMAAATIAAVNAVVW